MDGFKIPQINMFQQPVNSINAIGTGGAQRSGGSNPAFSGGRTAFEEEMADFRKFLPEYNGTGELQPKRDYVNFCYKA